MKTKLNLQHFTYQSLTVIILIVFLGIESPAQIFKSKTQPTTNTRQTTDRTVKGTQMSTSSPSHWRNDWRITLGVGPALSFGDIKQYKFYPVFHYKNEWRLGVNILAERQLSSVFSLRGQALYAQFAGTRREWNRNFKADNFEFNLNTAINLNNLMGRERKDRYFTTNLIIGIGLANYNTRLYELNSENILAERGFGNGSGIGGRTLEGILMAGLGFDFQLDENWSLRIESANRILNSDNFDLYDTHFKYDVYNYTSVGISYTFNTNKKRVSKVPESGEPTMLPPVIQNEPVAPEKSLNQVVEALAIESPTKAPEVETASVEPIKEVVTHEPVVLEIEYRVQIRARYEGKVSKSELSNKYNIAENEISESTHNHYYIYTIGSFSTYEQAAQKRNEVRSVNKVYDAFVVAFKNGERLDKLPK